MKLKICYHGTTKECAESILRNGFYPDSWFALHLEDALAFGGNHVLRVVFNEAGVPDHWQFHAPKKVPKEKIVGYSIYEIDVRFSRF